MCKAKDLHRVIRMMSMWLVAAGVDGQIASDYPAVISDGYEQKQQLDNPL
jgi:hypothetical protein